MWGLSSLHRTWLILNRRKCEVIHEADYHPTSENLDEFIQFTLAEAPLLGTALFAGQALDDLLSAKLDELRIAIERLEKDLSSRRSPDAQIRSECAETDVHPQDFTVFW